MVKIIITVILLNVFTGSLRAQESLMGSSSSLALSGAVAAYPDMNYPLNPANLGMQSPRIGINYYNRFLLPELGTASVFGSVNTFGGVSSFALGYFGTGIYNQASVSYTYGHQLTPWLNAGMRLNYHSYRVEAIQQQASGITGELGMQAFTQYGLGAGLHVLNPNQSGYNTEVGEQLPSIIKLGISWWQERDYYLSAQLNYTDYGKFSFHLGSEYWLKEVIGLRTGLALGADSNYSFGIVTQLKALSLELAFQRHQVLGMSSAVSLNYKLGTHE